MKSWATLAETVQGIRGELAQAMADGDGEQVRFDVGEVELEFTVEVQRNVEAGGGVKVWVVNADGKGAVSSGATHRVRVMLHPVDTATGRAPRVADRLPGLPPRRGDG